MICTRVPPITRLSQLVCLSLCHQTNLRAERSWPRTAIAVTQTACDYICKTSRARLTLSRPARDVGPTTKRSLTKPLKSHCDLFHPYSGDKRKTAVLLSCFCREQQPALGRRKPRQTQQSDKKLA